MDYLSRHNISFYTIPAVWALALMPRMYAVRAFQGATGKRGLDNRSPRDFKETIAREAGLDSRTRGRCARAEAASSNGIENLGIAAAAIVAGNMGGLSPLTLNALSIAYVLTRIVYNHVYIFNETRGLAFARSGTYMAGMGILMTMFVSAGKHLNKLVPLARGL